MGHFSMEIDAPTGSNLSGNQQNRVAKTKITRFGTLEKMMVARKLSLPHGRADLIVAKVNDCR